MKLQDFISETLKEIIAGVKEAQDYASEQNAKVNPSAKHIGDIESQILVDADNLEHLQNVDFDVAVMSTEGTEAKGGAGILVASIGFGIHQKTDTSNNIVNRVRFSVPLALPLQHL